MYRDKVPANEFRNFYLTTPTLQLLLMIDEQHPLAESEYSRTLTRFALLSR